MVVTLVPQRVADTMFKSSERWRSICRAVADSGHGSGGSGESRRRHGWTASRSTEMAHSRQASIDAQMFRHLKTICCGKQARL